jgi:hypothetical protein
VKKLKYSKNLRQQLTKVLPILGRWNNFRLNNLTVLANRLVGFFNFGFLYNQMIFRAFLNPGETKFSLNLGAKN